ncbi:MAG TPA: hypothetical protein DCZ95_03985 [Verrucomicrobia bacterium]|nr:hypothetical protein [Verrucomicrobiota bacterium]
MRHIDKEIYRCLPEGMVDTKFQGDALHIENCYCWYRELQDAEDGSMLLYYTDLPKADAVKKFRQHLIEEAGKALRKIRTEQSPPPYEPAGASGEA